MIHNVLENAPAIAVDNARPPGDKVPAAHALEHRGEALSASAAVLICGTSNTTAMKPSTRSYCLEPSIGWTLAMCTRQ